MATISTTTAIVVPAGALLKFAPGGQGRAVDPDGNSYILGLADVRCGPYAVAKTFQVVVTAGPIKYVVDADGSADDTMRVDDIEGTLTPGPAGAAAVMGAAMVLPATTITPAIRNHGLAHTDVSGVFSGHLTIRAPAEFDAIQVVMHGGTTSNTQAIKVSACSPAQYGNGYAPLDAGGAAMSFAPVTFGTTDRHNPRNPGGGAATGTIAGASGSSATNDLVEADIPSDWVALPSSARSDVVGNPPLLMLRFFGTNPPITGYNKYDTANSDPISVVLPETFGGYWATNDYTATSSPPAPVQGVVPSCTVRFLLRGKAVAVIGAAGDSIEQGDVVAGAVPASWGARQNGWARQFVGLLATPGRPTVYHQMAQSGHWSRQFHERAMNAVLGGSLTHLLLKPWSVNEQSLGVAGAQAAIRRAGQIVDLCVRRNVRVALVQPWGGQSSATARPIVDAWVANMAAQGIPVFDPRATSDADGGTNLRVDWCAINSGGTPVDRLHPNQVGHGALAALAYEQAKKWQGWIAAR